VKGGVGVGGITTKNLSIVSGRHWSYLHPDYRLRQLARNVCDSGGLSAYCVPNRHDAALANTQLRLGLCTQCEIRGFNGVGNIC
jgi:hypothetical protein